MTAVLGILNKASVALAADSAVTVGLGNGNSKIFNRANKLFALSKANPIGVMIYNSADLMYTPWEIIIKLYRKELGDTSHDTVEAYQTNFIEYLRSNKFFASIDDENKYLNVYFLRKLEQLLTIVLRNEKLKMVQLQILLPEQRAELVQKLESFVDEAILRFQGEKNYCPDLVNLEPGEFNEKIDPMWASLRQTSFVVRGLDVSAALDEKLKLYLLEAYKTNVFTHYSGLIFAGYGETQIYPQLVAIRVSGSFNGRLRYYVEGGATVTNDNPGAICPFAQTDVMDTIMQGIDPHLEHMQNNNIANAFKKYNDLLIEKLGDKGDEIKQILEAIDFGTAATELIAKNSQTKFQKNIIPLLMTINSLSKEDLAEMAESLIYLTYLKRRITFAEESVGGPVDVAVISKGDGFIWIKRKHYFKPELNQLFLNNYFKP